MDLENEEKDASVGVVVPLPATGPPCSIISKNKKKTRRGKRIKNKFLNFKALYVNLRGYKSKQRSVEEIVKDEKPTLIAFAETLVEKKEDINLKGYEILLPATKGSRGIMIAVRKEIKHITSIVMEDTDPAEQMWIKIANGRIDLRIGLIYAPQEKATVKVLQRMYDKIEEQINRGKEKNQKIMVLGDFNCKIGKVIPNNTEQVTCGGRLLNKLIEKTGMETLNAHPLCEGVWTRTEKGHKSVIDYVLINKEHIASLERMVIDENKDNTPYSEYQGERTYADHNLITVEMNWVTTSLVDKKERLVLNEKAKEKFKQVTEEGELSKIWEDEGTLQEKYDTWSEKVRGITKQIFITNKKKKKHKNRKIRKLRRKRKLLKIENAKEWKEINQERRKLLQQFIDEEKKKQEKIKIVETAKNIKKEGGFDANAFWKHLEQMRGGKVEVATAMFDENGNIEEDPEKIRNIYKTFYQKLLKDRDPEDEIEKEMQQLKEKCIEVMKRKAESKDIAEITPEEYTTMKNKLKKKKAPDQDGWRYEWIINAGADLENSIKLMLDTVRKEKQQPEQWRHMRIKSVSKKLTKRMDMNYKRGLFLTNILSKCMESILHSRNKLKLDESMHPFQNGGVNGMSYGDNLFMLNSTIWEFKKQKKNLYILFGDLEKCFDKLYLKDCIIEMEEAGMPVEEAIFLYEMNRNIKAVVDTPHGITEEFEIDEAVRQGTIVGSAMCGVSTNRINKMGQKDPTVVHGSIEIECPIFVDDIISMGSNNQIENTGRKMSGLEVTKKFQFNNKEDKTEYMVMKNNEKEEEQEIKIEVRKGKIKKTEDYKCLGDKYDSTGSNEIKIRKKMEKMKYMGNEVKRMGSYSKVGYADMSVRLWLLETTVKPTLLSNTETWCNISNNEEKLFTTYHHELLCIVFGQWRTTPYYGILGETGIWPYVYTILYKKLMYLHHIIHSGDERIIKKMVIKQQHLQTHDNDDETWYGELSNRVRPMDIDTSPHLVKKKKKSEWKKEIKQKLHKVIEKEFTTETQQKTKLRFQRGKSFKKEEYIEQCDAETCRKIMCLRLNMVQCKSNFKNANEDTSCVVCKANEETTEHLLTCEYYKHFAGEKLKPINRNELESVEWLVEAVKTMEIIQEVRQQNIVI